MDQLRVGRRGGGTDLVYRDSLNVVKISAGERESFEHSEWSVQLPSSHNLCVVIIYRPPYSEEHKVSTNTFFSEFSDYLKSIILSKEQLLITGDFNIHVDVATDSCWIYWNLLVCNSMSLIPPTSMDIFLI